jgi:hypothetical protein
MDVPGYSKEFSIDQGTVLGMDQLFQALFNQPLTDPKRDGICTGLSMLWAARRMMFHNENAKQRFQALMTGAAFKWGGKTQDIHLAAGGGGGDMYAQLQTMYKEALRAYVLRIVQSAVSFARYTDSAACAQSVAPTVTPSGRYCLYNIGLRTNTGDAGHRVAAYSSQGGLVGGKHCSLFDPIMGEYRISTSQVPSFLTAFLESYRAAFGGINYLIGFEVQRG